MNGGPQNQTKWSRDELRAFLLNPSKASGPQSNQTPLHLACIQENLPRIVKLLELAKNLKILPKCLAKQDGTGRTAEDVINNKIAAHMALHDKLKAIRIKTQIYSDVMSKQISLFSSKIQHLKKIVDIFSDARRKYTPFKNLQKAIQNLGRDENSPLLDKIDRYVQKHPTLLLLKDPDTGKMIFHIAIEVANLKLCDFLLDIAYSQGFLDHLLNACDDLGQTPQQNLNARMSCHQNLAKATLSIILKQKGLPEKPIEDTTNDELNSYLAESPELQFQKASYKLLSSIYDKISEYKTLQRMFPYSSLPSSVYTPAYASNTSTPQPSLSNSSSPSPTTPNPSLHNQQHP